MFRKQLLILCLFLPALSFAKTLVDTHGQLQVKGNQIVGQHGNAVSLAGPSFFWSNTGWGAEKFYTADAVKYFHREWNAGIVRAAIGTFKNGGYISDKAGNLQRAEAIIDAAIAEGIYVIVDWHSHWAEKEAEVASEFFDYIAKKYNKYPNIIYEIYNEPLDKTSWEGDIKPYANKIIPVIRKHDPDNLIVVGTRTWSQDVDEAAASPLEGYSNIVYTLHFYAGTHKAELRAKAQKALDAGLALMVTEWGTVNANGDGDVDNESVKEWMAFLKKNKLSHCSWSAHDKQEGASIFKPDTRADGKWSDADLTKSGLLVKSIVKNW